MGSFELELPDGLEEQIDTYLDETSQYLSKSELVRDAVRRVLENDTTAGVSGEVYINSQHVDTVRTESLKDVKAEHEWEEAPSSDPSSDESDKEQSKPDNAEGDG
jgi:Arc/MetJ-type ribon-helix-helix transcriptional regulator